jgi:hypothetical protein
MPYVNIPNSGLGGSVAKIVGKMQGQVMSKVLDTATNITNKLNREGCPENNEVQRLRNKLNQANNALSAVQSRLAKFKSLPGKLKTPLSGLEKALLIIKLLPIPQSVPPGFGIPVNISMKFADIMHLLKELIKQIDELIEAIEAVLETPSLALNSLKRNLGSADSACKSCEIEAALKAQLANGNLTQKDLDDLGLTDDDGDMIFSNLGPQLLAGTSNKGLTNSSKDSLKNTSDLNRKGKWTIGGDTDEDGTDGSGTGDGIGGSGTEDGIGGSGKGNKNLTAGRKYLKDQILKYEDVEYICLKDHLARKFPPDQDPEYWSSLDDAFGKSNNTIIDGLRKLTDGNIDRDTKGLIKSFLDTLKQDDGSKTGQDADYYYRGPNGDLYKLEIVADIDSPSIAPRRFAVAKDTSGVIVLRGTKSFSSSTQVLLDEIKFRIDNQLP